MKIFCHIPRENWIVDRMGIEYKEHSRHEVSFSKIDNDTDIDWLLGSWCWNQIPVQVLKTKKVVCTVHHEVISKFNGNRRNNFLERDKIVNHYLTYTTDTKKLITSLSTKNVKIIPHWVNSKVWSILDKNASKKELKLPQDKFIIGSFQRDTEGHDLLSPKLEKGPDIFIQKVLEIAQFKHVHVLLGGWRRQYVIENLKKNNISYTYIEMADINILNKMYNSLDLYIISSRCEGGPQALFEAAYLKIPILSTKSGQYQLLSKAAIYDFNEKFDNRKIESANKAIITNNKNVNSLIDTKHIKNYDTFFESII